MRSVFGIGETELVLILLFAFMIFGPDKLPGMGRTLGRALRQFRDAQEGFTQVVQTEIVDPAAEAMSDNPKKPNRARAAGFEEDADLEAQAGSEDAAPKKAETFAERKKRLAAERKAVEEAAAAASAEKDADDAGTEVSAGGDPAGSEASPAFVASSEPEVAPVPRSAADLYAMTPARPIAPVQTSEPAAPEPAPEHGAPTDSVSTENTGKEGGSVEA